MLAVNPDEEIIVDHPEINKTIVDIRPAVPTHRTEAPIVLVDTSVNDEVDSFLKELAAEDRGQSLLVDEEGYMMTRSWPATTAPGRPRRRADSEELN